MKNHHRPFSPRLFTLAAAALLTAGASLPAQPADDQAALPAGWKSDEAVTATSTTFQGRPCVRITHDGNQFKAATYRFPDSPAAKTITFAVSVSSKTLPAAVQVFGTGAKVFGDNRLVNLAFMPNGRLAVNNADDLQGATAPYSADEWIEVRLVLDDAGKTYQASVNGTPIAADLPYFSSASAHAAMLYIAVKDGATISIADIEVSP